MAGKQEANTREASSWWLRPSGGREVLQVALPLVVSAMSWTVMTFMDRVFLMWESGTAMAAAFSASTVWFAVLCLPLGICTYANTFVSQYFGSERPERIGPATWHGVWTGLLLTPPVLMAIPLAPLVFAFASEEHIDVFPFCWCPRQNAEGRTRDKRVPYLTWAQRGQMFLTEGDSVDYDALRELLRRARDEWKWNMQEIHFDPNNARYLITKLVEEDGFRTDQVIEHIQTCGHMNDPIALTEKAILDKRLRHGGHEPLRWCVSNVKVYTDTGGRRRFDKKKSSEKIDLAVALAMGVGTALTLRKNQSPYATRGILTL